MVQGTDGASRRVQREFQLDQVWQATAELVYVHVGQSGAFHVQLLQRGQPVAERQEVAGADARDQRSQLTSRRSQFAQHLKQQLICVLVKKITCNIFVPVFFRLKLKTEA